MQICRQSLVRRNIRALARTAPQSNKYPLNLICVKYGQSTVNGRVHFDIIMPSCLMLMCVPGFALDIDVIYLFKVTILWFAYTDLTVFYRSTGQAVPYSWMSCDLCENIVVQ